MAYECIRILARHLKQKMLPTQKHLVLTLKVDLIPNLIRLYQKTEHYIRLKESLEWVPTQKMPCDLKLLTRDMIFEYHLNGNRIYKVN